MGDKPQSPMLLRGYQDLALKRKAYRASYATYWESTKEKTNTGRLQSQSRSIYIHMLNMWQGRPVDAVIMPVAPHAAVLNRKYYYYGSISSRVC